MIPKVIVFDVFGTLVQIQQGHSPYKKLIKHLRAQGRNYMPNDALTLMSLPYNFQQFADFFGYSLSNKILNELDQDLFCDLQSLVLYEDTLSVLDLLKQSGFKLAVCSNLAKPYGERVFSMLPGLDAYIWSYEIGAIKPDPLIYQVLIDKVGCAAHEIIFVGDTLLPDVHGPESAGMSARLINRNIGQNLHDVLSDFF